MRLKLKSLGYDSELSYSNKPRESRSRNSLQSTEQAFMIIDNFSSEVLAIHKNIQKLRASA